MVHPHEDVVVRPPGQALVERRDLRGTELAPLGVAAAREDERPPVGLARGAQLDVTAGQVLVEVVGEIVVARDHHRRDAELVQHRGQHAERDRLAVDEHPVAVEDDRSFRLRADIDAPGTDRSILETHHNDRRMVAVFSGQDESRRIDTDAGTVIDQNHGIGNSGRRRGGEGQHECNHKKPVPERDQDRQQQAESIGEEQQREEEVDQRVSLVNEW